MPRPRTVNAVKANESISHAHVSSEMEPSPHATLNASRSARCIAVRLSLLNLLNTQRTTRTRSSLGREHRRPPAVPVNSGVDWTGGPKDRLRCVGTGDANAPAAPVDIKGNGQERRPVSTLAGVTTRIQEAG